LHFHFTFQHYHIFNFFLERNIINDSEINCVDKVHYWLNNEQTAKPHCTEDNVIMNTATDADPILKSTESNDLLEISATRQW